MEEIKPGFFRKKKSDGGYDLFYRTNDGQVRGISLEQMQRYSNLAPAEILGGSTNPGDAKYQTMTAQTTFAPAPTPAPKPTPKPTPSGGGGGGGYSAPAAPSYEQMVAQYAAEQRARDDAQKQLLQRVLDEVGYNIGYTPTTFDEAEVRRLAEETVNPFWEDKTTKLKSANESQRGLYQSDWKKTADALATQDSNNRYNQAVTKTNLFDNLGASGTARSGVGLRKWATGEVGNVMTNEGNASDQTANTTGLNSRLNVLNTNEANTLSDYSQQRASDVQSDFTSRQNDWRASEANRLSEYEKARTQAYQTALARVYGVK